MKDDFPVFLFWIGGLELFEDLAFKGGLIRL